MFAIWYGKFHNLMKKHFTIPKIPFNLHDFCLHFNTVVQQYPTRKTIVIQENQYRYPKLWL